MKKYGIVSYNIHGNYTNYGSVLQSYALQTALKKKYREKLDIEIINYIPEAIEGKNPLAPLEAEKNISDEFRNMVSASMPAIKENFHKISDFVESQYSMSKKIYTKDNFESSYFDENLDGYIVGSDAIWMIDFFGEDKGFWGDFSAMRQSHTVAYAASFGESLFDNDKRIDFLGKSCKNFKAIGLREPRYIDLIRQQVDVPIKQVVDPTLLLRAEDYSNIISEKLYDDPYILIYSRKYNPSMDEYVDLLANKYGYKVIEISLRAQNSDRHIMMYSAGIEEFLSLIKYAQIIVTNSLHASIFATLFHRPISFFERNNACYKVNEFFNTINVQKKAIQLNDNPVIDNNVDYEGVDEILEQKRCESFQFIEEALAL